MNFVELESLMLRAKFHRTFGSGVFLKVFTINGGGGHFGHVTCTININFRFPFPRRLHMKEECALSPFLHPHKPENGSSCTDFFSRFIG